MISYIDIKTKVDVIILSLRSFDEKREEMPDQKYNVDGNQFEILKKIYFASISLGVNIPID
jgi:hypothetical protein